MYQPDFVNKIENGPLVTSLIEVDKVDSETVSVLLDEENDKIDDLDDSNHFLKEDGNRQFMTPRVLNRRLSFGLQSPSFNDSFLLGSDISTTSNSILVDKHDVESCTGLGSGIVRIRSVEVKYAGTKWTSHMITVEELDGNWRIYRWTEEGFLCYSRKKQRDSKYHLCCQSPGLFSLNQVYQACSTASEGKKYDLHSFNCNAWTEKVMELLTGQTCFKANAWAKCRNKDADFQSCTDLSLISRIEPQDIVYDENLL